MFEKAAKQAATEIKKIERFEKKMSKIKQPKIYLEPAVLCMNCQILIQK